MHINEIRGTILAVLHLAEQLLSVLFWILLIYGFDEPVTAGLTVIAAVIHECGHEGYLFFAGARSGRVRGRLFGFGIGGAVKRGYGDEIMLYLSGPLANVALAAIFFLLRGALGEYALLGALLNLVTAASNLLPVEGHDGYGIIRTLLDRHAAPRALYRVLESVSFGITVLACFLALYLLGVTGDGYWIFAVFFSGMLSSMSKRLKSTKFENS